MLILIVFLRKEDNNCISMSLLTLQHVEFWVDEPDFSSCKKFTVRRAHLARKKIFIALFWIKNKIDGRGMGGGGGGLI